MRHYVGVGQERADGDERIAESLLARPPPGQTAPGALFVSAVKRCLAVGSKGEALLRDAFPKVPLDRQLTIVLAISYYPTEAAASLLKAQAGDPKVDTGLRCCAVWALARLRRPEDGDALASLLVDRSLYVRDQALLVCPHHGGAVAPEVTLEVFAKLTRRKSIGQNLEDLTPFTEVVSLFAFSGSGDPGHLASFAGHLRDVWPRISDSERDWLGRFWPEAASAARGPSPLEMMSQLQNEQLHQWWEQHPFFRPPPIY